MKVHNLFLGEDNINEAEMLLKQDEGVGKAGVAN